MNKSVLMNSIRVLHYSNTYLSFLLKTLVEKFRKMHEEERKTYVSSKMAESSIHLYSLRTLI